MQRAKPYIVVLSGAGISAESGIKTFRDADGLWENHRIEDVATPDAWQRDPELVLEFYNQRRRNVRDVKPNAAHIAVKDMEEFARVQVITQNIDDLHERAGSKRVLHLHGEILKVRSTANPSLIYDWTDDVNLGDACSEGSQLRPHIVWFGEAVPMMEPAVEYMLTAEAVIIVGTSMQVYPAAGLLSYAPPYAPVYYIDPRPAESYELNQRLGSLTIIKEPATHGMQQLVEVLRQKYA